MGRNFPNRWVALFVGVFDMTDLTSATSTDITKWVNEAANKRLTLAQYTQTKAFDAARKEGAK